LPREICISDIHGCAEQFKKLLRMIGRLEEDDQLILLGDYCDRGPDSAKVYKTLRRLKKNYDSRVTLLYGNHCDLLFCYSGVDVSGDYDDTTFLYNGGRATIRSFNEAGIDLKTAARWLKNNSQVMFETERAVYVHAGLYTNRSTNNYEKIWTRDLATTGTQPKLLIAGHTPVACFTNSPAPYFNERKNYIIIDNGCAYGDGPLLAYDIANDTAYYSDGTIVEHILFK